MGKRRGTKIKAVAPPTEDALAAALGLTVERYRRDEWVQGAAIAMHGEKANVRENMPRRLSRALRWQKDGWVDEAGAASLIRYEMLVDASGYGHTRSCIDPSPRGGAGDLPGRVERARWELARLRNRVQTACLPHALTVTHELLLSPETIEDASTGLVHGKSWEARRPQIKALIGMCAGALAGAFGARMAA